LGGASDIALERVRTTPVVEDFEPVFVKGIELRQFTPAAVEEDLEEVLGGHERVRVRRPPGQLSPQLVQERIQELDPHFGRTELIRPHLIQCLQLRVRTQKLPQFIQVKFLAPEWEAFYSGQW